MAAAREISIKETRRVKRQQRLVFSRVFPNYTNELVCVIFDGRLKQSYEATSLVLVQNPEPRTPNPEPEQQNKYERRKEANTNVDCEKVVYKLEFHSMMQTNK